VAFAIVRFYLLANILFAAAAVALLVVRSLNARLARPMSYRQQLQLGCALAVAALVGPWLTLPSAGADLVPAMTQVWAAPSMKAVSVSSDALAGAMISAGSPATSLPLHVLTTAIVMAGLMGLAVALVRIVRGAWSVRRVLVRAHLIRRVGALRVLASEEIAVPFSCWVPGACCIFVPSSLILRPRDLRVALLHEGQHHRQGDTRIVYVMELLRGLFFLNPLMPVLLKQLHTLQELACDEALIRDHRVVVREYCECLIRVAQSAVDARRPISGLHMADPGNNGALARRVHAALDAHRARLVPWKGFAMNSMAVLALLVTGAGLSGAVHDRRVSLAEAQELAAAARSESVFPIVINEQVLAELNRFLGTPDGRAFLRDGLRRMGAHERLISARLAEHGLPAELLAVPLVESGYRNLAQGANPPHSAGIWQFIRPTARRFGLAVEAGQDERLNVASETEAAMRMFSSLHQEFGDWGFALLAFNGGSDLVHRAVRDAGATDAFLAAEYGYENDRGYVARVTAAAIVLKNSRRLQLFP
jgi:beta-lactamase regulating signal transducer with metallopeptidase domain